MTHPHKYITRQSYKAALILAFAAFGASASTLTIDAKTSAGKLEVTAFDSAAWTVCSLKVRGVEYLDAYDHGRCLQSAISFNNLGEADNPTQAGSARDGVLSNPSSSHVITLAASGDSIASSVQMAYWRGGLSPYIFRQNIMIGLGPLGNVLRHDVSMDANGSIAQAELLTAYLPAMFSHFRTLDPATGVTAELSDGPGEQAMPVVFCTPDDKHCMGIASADPLTGGGYGRWRYAPWQCQTTQGFTGCVKFNAVTRIVSPSQPIRRTVFTAVGNLADVVGGLRWAVATPVSWVKVEGRPQ